MGTPSVRAYQEENMKLENLAARYALAVGELSRARAERDAAIARHEQCLSNARMAKTNLDKAAAEMCPDELMHAAADCGLYAPGTK